MKTISRFGWHIIEKYRKLRYNDDRIVRVGIRMKWSYDSWDGDGKIKICQRGMHASQTPADAYRCVNGGFNLDGAWLCRVLVDGSGYGDRFSRSRGHMGGGKFVGTHRTVLGMVRLHDVMTPDVFISDEAILELMRKRNRKNGVKTEVR